MHNFATLKLTELENRILLITLNRPRVYNAINSEMMRELKILWQEFYVNRFAYRALILTGEAPAFCAGADLKERKNLDLPLWQAHHRIFEQAMIAMIDCPIPLIAAVNGAAYGGGLELVMACDFAYAATTATFAQPELKVGLIPGAMGTQQLARTCGLKRAKELIFTGRAFSAEEALQYGIINEVYEPEILMEEVILNVKAMCEQAPLAMQEAKKCLNLSQAVDLKTGFEFELAAYYRILPTKDREEGIKAFNEKRKAKFLGE